MSLTGWHEVTRQPLLQVRAAGLTYHYGPRNGGIEVLHANFDVEGRCVAVLGPNGAGKTTLIRLLATVFQIQGGRLEIGGHDLAQPSSREGFRRSLGFLPQDLRMPAGYRCSEFLRYVCELRGVPTREMTSCIEMALDTVELSDRAEHRIGALSGGMKQRLAIAQAIVSQPKTVLLDEPTVGLDPAQRVAFRDFVSRINISAGVLLSTHLIEDVAALASHIVLLIDGSVHFCGTVGEFVESSAPGVPAAMIERAFLKRLHAAEASDR